MRYNIHEHANWQEGFREGADVGRQRLAQEGFNSGYCNGIEDGMKRGHVLGQLKYALRKCIFLEGSHILIINTSIDNHSTQLDYTMVNYAYTTSQMIDAGKNGSSISSYQVKVQPPIEFGKHH